MSAPVEARAPPLPPVFVPVAAVSDTPGLALALSDVDGLEMHWPVESVVHVCAWATGMVKAPKSPIISVRLLSHRPSRGRLLLVDRDLQIFDTCVTEPFPRTLAVIERRRNASLLLGDAGVKPFAPWRRFL